MSDSDTNGSSSTDQSSRPISPARIPSSTSHSSHPTRISSLVRHDRPLNAEVEDDLRVNRDQDRRNIILMDRKRRLTGSAIDSGRRRHDPRGNSSLLYERVEVGEDSQSSSTGPRSAQTQHREVVDLTGSSPPAQQPSPRRHRSSRTSSSSSRRYVVPRWQPDTEASECPICGRQFTWLFRRHHCRKCGRVVCNDCSPHRITIPRQYIVNPPDADYSTSPTTSNASRPTETIDLTRDDDDEAQPRRRYLDGGEKVRLCNPCVPDPQPEPLATFPPFMERRESGSQRPVSGVGHNYRPSTNILGQSHRHRSSFSPSFTPSTSMPSRSDLFGPHYGRPRPSSNAYPSNMFPPGLDPRFEYPRPSRSGSMGNHGSVASQNPLPPLPSSLYGHGRYASMDSRDRFDPDLYRRSHGNASVDHHSRDRAAHPQSSRPGRPPMKEEDICPICRRALPPKGADGDETTREAHIMECITSRDHSSGTGGEGSSSRPAMMHMVAFTASEKDCLGEDGNVQECSICMVEYDPGDVLARLECFCKFHKLCIVSWLNRKAECPVHKASSLH